MIMLMIC